MSGRERGNALVEFAIASTAALTLMLGIIDSARALYTYHLVSSAARQGTRYAMVRGSSCTAAGCPASADTIQTYVRGLAPGIDPSSLAVTTTWSSASGCTDPANQGAGCVVAVNASYPFRFIIPLLPRFTMTMSSTSQIVISQ
ncbi:MAG: TadE family protein [Candidatus Eremiobacteraeota bacterium]|nr:TadE family protein [Candidatus Eremiobacteraeota bacterium]